MMTMNRRTVFGHALTSTVLTASGCAAIAPAAASICKAAPYVPGPASAAAGSGDAELMRLGNELRKELADHIPVWRRWRDLQRAFEPEARRLPGSLNTPEGLIAYEALHREMGVEAASDENDRACDAIDELCKCIHAIQPTTVAGLRAWYGALLWQGTTVKERAAPPSELDFDRQAIFAFAAELDRLAGMQGGAEA